MSKFDLEKGVDHAATLLTSLYRAVYAPLLTAVRNHVIPELVGASEIGRGTALPSIEGGIASFVKQVRAEGVLYVDDANSDTAIYGKVGNILFRKVHDLGHILYHCEFNTEGETELHKRLWSWLETSALFWKLSSSEQRMVYLVYMADTHGQTMYFEKTGEFPVNQREFVINYVKEHLNAQV